MKKMGEKLKSIEALAGSTLKNTNQAKGITLIALVITIIVLIILAGVTINTLTGDNSIINNAIKAKDETRQKSDLEQLEIAVASSYDYGNGSTKILIDELNKNLKEIEGFDESTTVIELPAVVKIHGKEYAISLNGNVSDEIPDNEEAPVYAVFYTDKNELVFQLSDTIDTTRGSAEDGTAIVYSGIETLEISNSSENPWYADENCKLIQTVTFAERIYPKSTAWWFCYCEKLATINNIEKLKTKNVTNMRGMFIGCSGLKSLDLGGFDTSNVTDMELMFAYCSGLTTLDLSGFDTENVTNMAGMFRGCRGLTNINLSDLDTRNVTKMNFMFAFCSGLETLDLSSFDTSNVTIMYDMFEECSGLTSLEISNFNTSNVTDMSSMFRDCSGLTSIYVSNNWNIKKVSSSSAMFLGCTNLVGKIAYNSTKIDATYANYTTGYLTLKTD